METVRLNNQSVDLSRFELRVLGQEWNDRLLHLTRNSPVDAGRFRIYFDRSPDIFAIPRLTSYKYKCLGLFEEDELLGYAFASFQKRYLNGLTTDVIYLGNMHVFQKGLGRIFLQLLSNRLCSIIPKNRDVKYIYAYVTEGNIPAMKLSGLGFFSSRVVGQISMVNIMLLYPVKLNQKYTVRRAEPTDIETIINLLQKDYRQRFLAPEMNKDIFMKNLAGRPRFNIHNYYLALSGDEVIGVCSAWDMTALKKNRILKYSYNMKLKRWIYNVGASIFGAARLPKAGEALGDVTIAEFAIKYRDPDIMEAILRYLNNLYRKQGFHSIIFGSSKDDPLLKATDAFIAKHICSNVIVGTLRSSYPGEDTTQPWIYADAVQI